jgi:tRNA(fMet)-specific endonuclease VapC
VIYLLDTDILSYIARGEHDALAQKVRSIAPEAMGMSVITRGEIEFGLVNRPVRQSTAKRMRSLFETIKTLELPARAASHYCDVRFLLQRAGTPIGNNDLWIGCHALAGGLTVVTNNEREFRRVPGLSVENWIR